jgi:hypothetical protein
MPVMTPEPSRSTPTNRARYLSYIAAARREEAKGNTCTAAMFRVLASQAAGQHPELTRERERANV